jgi:glycerophosphoryl diester phosphodiesterase
VEHIGHRGAPREALENTLPSFARALALHADAIELDVHVTSDGVVVVHHDETLGTHPIRSTAWRKLQAIDLGGGTRVPMLEQVLELVGDRAAVYIELKGRDVEAPALRIARQAGRRFAVHSFDHAVVERAARLAQDVARGVLLDEGISDAIAAMRHAVSRTAARDVWPHVSLVDREFMTAADALGVRVLVWTVNTREQAIALRDLGVAGICTDDLSLLDAL